MKGKKRILGLAILILLIITASCSYTAKVYDRNNQIIELAVDYKYKVEINNTKQWIFPSGASEDNPVILWLDGGPGGSEVGWVREYLGPLHEHFTVVCWDQRGTAKSYGAVRDRKDMLVEDFVQDVIELSEYLGQRFNQEKIYLVGHSWGTIIGLMAVERRPDLFFAYIGAAQQINSIENDSIGWDMIHSGALAGGNTKLVKTLEEQGKPPYATIDEDGRVVGDGKKYYTLLSNLYRYSPHAPADAGFNSLKMFLAPEHTLKDRVNLVRGLMDGVHHIYPQLAFLDFEKDITKLEIPIFVVNARYDYTCVASITERWYQQLEAPVKDLLWLENSGHNGVYTEPDVFIDYMVNTVLPAAREYHASSK
jgi:pimeloyl-ACP methyl ester carboxylesterase